MNSCQRHWDKLREAIAARGLDSLVAPDGQTAVAQLRDEIEREQTPANFDPLMAAHWAIQNNGTQMIRKVGGNPLYLLTSGPEEPLVLPGELPDPEGRTWPRCTLCWLNLWHEVGCTDPDCTLPMINGYDQWIDRAADDSLNKARELGLRETA